VVLAAAVTVTTLLHVTVNTVLVPTIIEQVVIRSITGTTGITATRTGPVAVSTSTVLVLLPVVQILQKCQYWY
jgi:hypothetical protein